GSGHGKCYGVRILGLNHGFYSTAPLLSRLRMGHRSMNEFTARLSRLDSCAVSDALDKLGLKGSVTGIRRFSTDKRIAGRVLTVKLDRAEGRSNTRHLGTTAIE